MFILVTQALSTLTWVFLLMRLFLMQFFWGGWALQFLGH